VTNSLGARVEDSHWSRLQLAARFILTGNAAAFRAPTHMTSRELLVLYGIAKSLAPGQTAVEIGSYLGASSSFIAAGCHVAGAHLYCVDTWDNSAMSEGPRDTFAQFKENTRRYAATITPLRMLSAGAGVGFPGTVDFLLVDGDHSEAGVRADLAAWLPRLRGGAWLVLHDCGWADGVVAAIADTVRPICCADPLVLPNLFCARVDPGMGRNYTARAR
jgi:predicted O-methyltransferase YrrM